MILEILASEVTVQSHQWPHIQYCYGACEGKPLGVIPDSYEELHMMC